LVHEVLISSWRRLSHWVDDSREFRSWQDKLEENITRWKLAHRDEKELLHGARLVEAKEKLKQYWKVVTTGEWVFIEASVELCEKEAQEQEQQRQERERLQRRNLRVLAVSFIVAMVLRLFGWWQWGMAEQQSEMARLRYDGIFFERSAKYQEALVSYQKSLDISQNLRDDKAQAINLSDSGMMYMNLKEFEQALDYFKRAVEIRKRLGDNEGVKFEIGNVTSAYGKLGQPEKALDYYQQALGVGEKGRGKLVG